MWMNCNFQFLVLYKSFSSTCFIYLPVLDVGLTTGLVNLDAPVWNKQQQNCRAIDFVLHDISIKSYTWLAVIKSR